MVRSSLCVFLALAAGCSLDFTDLGRDYELDAGDGGLDADTGIADTGIADAGDSTVDARDSGTPMEFGGIGLSYKVRGAVAVGGGVLSAGIVDPLEGSGNDSVVYFDGASRWAMRISGGATDRDDQLFDIAARGNRALAVGLTRSHSAGEPGALMVTADSDGIMSVDVFTVAGVPIAFRGLATDAAGWVALGRFMDGTAGSANDHLVTVQDAKTVSVYRIGGSGTGFLRAAALTLDTVYAVGQEEKSLSDSTGVGLVVALGRADGALQWARTYEIVGRDVLFHNVVLNAAGDLVVTGGVSGPDQALRFTLSADGEQGEGMILPGSVALNSRMVDGSEVIVMNDRPDLMLGRLADGRFDGVTFLGLSTDIDSSLPIIVSDGLAQVVGRALGAGGCTIMDTNAGVGTVAPIFTDRPTAAPTRIAVSRTPLGAELDLISVSTLMCEP